MSDEVVIRVEKLGKRYRIRHQQQGGMRYKALRDVLADGTKSLARRLWSLTSVLRDLPCPSWVYVTSEGRRELSRMLSNGY